MNFAVFIISHERSERVETYDTLIDSGCVDPIYVVVDDEDTQLQRYKERFGKSLLVFDKSRYVDEEDTVSGEKYTASAMYARNAVEDFAKSFNMDSFIMFDDDILRLRYRYICDNKIKSNTVGCTIHELFKLYGDFLISNNITDISFASVMFYCGGIDAVNYRVSNFRQCYAIHFRNTNIPMRWKGVMNEDFITVQDMAKRGYIFLTLPFILYETTPTNIGGGTKETCDTMSEFRRSMLVTQVLSSCCRPVAVKGKIVNSYSKTKTFPMIISSRYKK